MSTAGNYGVICRTCNFDGDCDRCPFHLARLRERYAGMAMASLLGVLTGIREEDIPHLVSDSIGLADALVEKLSGKER